MKTLQDLINLEEPAWEWMQEEWFSQARNHYEIIPKNPIQTEKELLVRQPEKS